MIYGLSERCYPKATMVGFQDPPEGITAEPIHLTVQRNTGTLEIGVAESVVPDAYVLVSSAPAYAHNQATLALHVAAP